MKTKTEVLRIEDINVCKAYQRTVRRHIVAKIKREFIGASSVDP
jgi:hypothetical protein